MKRYKVLVNDNGMHSYEDAVLHTEAAALVGELAGLLRDLHEWRGVGMDKLEAWEHIAAMFKRDTGYLRPGKDESPYVNTPEGVREKAWAEWVTRKNDELDCRLAAVLAKAEGVVNG